ncbi:DUF3088 family protein [Morganella morganii]|nr:DUF3088 family protein [Morganella morganii]ELB1013739.1 DUF3088 family protein [Morganella morganii]
MVDYFYNKREEHMKNTLYLLKMGFSDLNYPGSLFLCPDCTLLEGVLATNPELRESTDVVYVDFDKPRKLLVDLIGEENQSLPVLVFADGQNFINDVDGILAEFAMTNGCPAKHP